MNIKNSLLLFRVTLFLKSENSNNKIPQILCFKNRNRKLKTRINEFVLNYIRVIKFKLNVQEYIVNELNLLN